MVPPGRSRFLLPSPGPYQPEIVAAREATSPASLVERARHEVAHAVVAVALGGVVLECTTMETQVSGGHVTFVVPVGDVDRALWVDLVTCLAGFRAFGGDDSRRLRRTCRDDVIEAAGLAAQLVAAGGRYGDHEATVTNLIRAAAEEADRLLAMHATAVDELVGALQVRRALDHATIATAIGVQPGEALRDPSDPVHRNR